MVDNTDQIDRIDRKILSELSIDARLSMAALADRIGLSKSPTLARVRRLEERGVITGYAATVDPSKLGLAHVAFVQVTLDNTRTEALDAFDYLLKVRTRDIVDYRRTLGETIAALPHVAQTSTFVTMETVK